MGAFAVRPDSTVGLINRHFLKNSKVLETLIREKTLHSKFNENSLLSSEIQDILKFNSLSH